MHSEETLREIDLEVKRLVDESYRCAYEVLMSKRPVLDQLSEELFEMETMSAEHMHKVIDQHRDGPNIVPGTSVTLSEAIQRSETGEDDVSDTDVPEAADGA